jgi:hypothetical protein
MDVRIYGSNDCENGSAEEAGDWAVLWRFGGDSKASTSDSADPSSTASENCIRMIDSSAVEAALLGSRRAVGELFRTLLIRGKTFKEILWCRSGCITGKQRPLLHRQRIVGTWRIYVGCNGSFGCRVDVGRGRLL